MEELIENTKKLTLLNSEDAHISVEKENTGRPKRSTKVPVAYSTQPIRRSTREKKGHLSYRDTEEHIIEEKYAKKASESSEEEPIIAKTKTAKTKNAKPKSVSKSRTVKKRSVKTEKKRLRHVSLPNKKKVTLKNDRMIKSLPNLKPNSIIKEKTLESLNSEIINEDLEKGKRLWLDPDIQERIFRVLAGESRPVIKGAPELLILVGPSASGKSTVKRQLDFTNAVNIDVDEIRIIYEDIIGKRSNIFSDFPTLIQIMMNKAISENRNMILDTTGKMKPAIQYVIKKAKEAGYKITMAVIYTTLEKCIKNATFRNNENPNRYMPIGAIKQIYNDFKNTKIAKYYLIYSPKLMKSIDHLYLFDNSQDTPEPAQIILEQHLPNTPIVHKEHFNFYDIDVSSKWPYFSRL